MKYTQSVEKLCLEHESFFKVVEIIEFEQSNPIIEANLKLLSSQYWKVFEIDDVFYAGCMNKVHEKPVLIFSLPFNIFPFSELLFHVVDETICLNITKEEIDIPGMGIAVLY